MGANKSPLRQTAHSGAGNKTSFNLINSDGSPLNLSNLTDTLVSVSVNNPDGANWVIDSSTDDVRFDGSILYVKFGKLNLPTGHYYPRISYTHSAETEPEVILAHGAETELLLTAYLQ